MKSRTHLWLCLPSGGMVVACLWLSLLAAFRADAAGFARGVVSTVHPLATDAATEAMRRGGNAIDAAVAAGLTLGVVDPQNSGIGGGCFMLIRSSEGTVVALDGRETAPARATRDMFIRQGKSDSSLSQEGPLAAGVPGSLSVYDRALRLYGKLSLREHLTAAARLAEKGFPVSRDYQARLAATAEALRRFPASRSVFLKPDGSIYETGDTFHMPDLAATYRQVGVHGINWFYGGPFAEKTAAWMRDHGGIMTVQDLRDYDVAQRQPLKTTYRGYTVMGFPPPSSGGVHVGQILNILENFDVTSLGLDSAAFVHLVAEAMKLAFADRAYWLGDADFVKVPRGLVSKDYARALARRIRSDRTLKVTGHGQPPRAATDLLGRHTTHFSTADAEGNWVACTATVNTSFGSKAVVPGTGVVLNNQMDDFSIQPGVPNFFGLVGAEANAVAPGKRPLSSMSPTILLKDGVPILSVGAAGGPTIISQTLLVILRVVDFEQPLEQALAAGRFHHQWKPDELRLERRWSEETRRALESLGHQIKVVPGIGVCQAVGFDINEKTFMGVYDPRVQGKAAGW